MCWQPWVVKLFCLGWGPSHQFFSHVGTFSWVEPILSNEDEMSCLTLCLPVSSADNFGKQFGPRSGPTNRRAWSGSKLFDILMVFLKEFFQKVNFEKNQQTTKKHEKLPSRQWVKDTTPLPLWDSNPRPWDHKYGTLPTELTVLPCILAQTQCKIWYCWTTVWCFNSFKGTISKYQKKKQLITFRVWIQDLWKGEFKFTTWLPCPQTPLWLHPCL